MNGKTNHGIFKKLLLVFVMTVLCALFAVSASAETVSGECGKQGDNVTWTFDTETGTLTIDGEGEMAKYQDYIDEDSIFGEPSYPSRPWKDFDIKTLIVEEGVTSIGTAFRRVEKLSTVVLPQSLLRIEDKAFEDCKTLTKIDIPFAESIGERAFASCISLEEIRIPQGVKSIGLDAFTACLSLKAVKIPASVVSIEPDINNGYFFDCFSLERISIDTGNLFYSSDDCGVLFNKDKTMLLRYPAGNLAESYKIPDTVQSINDFSFSYNFNIKNVTLCNNLESIGKYAFIYCFRLQNIVFPETLKRIDDIAFGYCFSMKNVVLPEGLESIGELAFVDTLLDKVTIKSINTQIVDMALCATNIKLIDNVSFEDFINLFSNYIVFCETGDVDDEKKWEQFNNELSEYIIDLDDIQYLGTIRCHAGSTAEAYAKENGIDCELIHFFGDWVYDWDNLVRSRKCSVCDYTETEPLEKTENGGVEIVEPVDPDTEFIVEEITKNGDKYAVVEKTLGENLEGDYSILKTFDITLKNKDGVHVQPDGIVKVKLPLDWDKDGDYKVYRVNDDGTLTDMEAYREGSHMVFDTDHFSVYVIVDESPAQPEEPEENNSPFGFIAEVIRMFKELLNKIIEFFQSIGDMT